MGLQDMPKRGTTSIYDDDGTTRVPKSVRTSDDLEWHKGQNITWVKMPNEDFARVYTAEDEQADEHTDD